ncbi:MAG: YggS family pyridoxal phosphate-dependent enzyme [Desulfobacteraceae bacterium]|nr:MAG: YggS family pyridoxal phosphate-dependent enzyme [Desulfobacteraceae bacterium]
MIRERVKKILGELPPGVRLVGAAKTRTPEEIMEAIDGGLEIVGENYVQEAERAVAAIGRKVKWHMIGHLQTNKARKAVQIFDMVETVDSMRLAAEIDRCCEKIGKTMPVLIEINSGGEERKSGVLPEKSIQLIEEVAGLPRVKIMGLMTMGPVSEDPEESRPYFRKTRELFEQVKKLRIPGAEMSCLSMGMSGSYRVALEEGANLVRIGELIFGERKSERSHVGGD